MLSQSYKEHKDELFELAVHQIIEAYTTKNDTLLNKYIESEVGIYFILKANDEQYLLHRSQICLNVECISSYNFPSPYAQILLEQRLDTTKHILYLQKPLEIEEYKEILVDEKEIHILTNSIRKSSIKNKSNFTHTQLRNIWKLESNSKRIRVTKDGHTFGNGKFTFYLSYLNNNWYLSAIYFNY